MEVATNYYLWGKKEVYLSMLKILSFICYTLAITFFIYSLTQTVLITDLNEITGIWLLIGGSVGILFFQFAWYANFLSLLALLLVQKTPKKSIIISLVAIALASQSFFLEEVPFKQPIQIVAYQLAFYFWYFSHFLILWGSTFHLLSLSQKEDSQIQKLKTRQLQKKQIIFHVNEVKPINSELKLSTNLINK